MNNFYREFAAYFFLPIVGLFIGTWIGILNDPTHDLLKKMKEDITKPTIGCQMKCCGCSKEIH